MRVNKAKLAAIVFGIGICVPEFGAVMADTAYVANEQTATIAVIDTSSRTVTTTIGLGSDQAIPGTPQPNGPFNGELQHHNPFYNGHVDTHGLWLTPNGSVLLVANRISGTVVAIDTATNTVLGYTSVGREPHLATVRPGGREAWVAIRGESHIDVLSLDPQVLFNSAVRRTDRMPKIASIDTARGPSMVSFTADGRFAFVTAGKEPRVDKIDADTRAIVASQTISAAFTPFGLVPPDDRELYLVHKGAGTLSVLRTDDLSFVVNGLPIGARANHIFFVGKLAYITIGGPAPSAGNPDPEGKIVIFNRNSHKIVNELTGPAFTGDPHAVWAASDGRLFIGHERGNRVTVIDTRNANNPNDDVVEGVVTDSDPDGKNVAFMKRLIDIVIKP